MSSICYNSSIWLQFFNVNQLLQFLIDNFYQLFRFLKLLAQMLENTYSLSQKLNDSNLSQQLEEYRKINHKLKRKLRQKDSKIQQLFNYIDDFGRQYINPEHYRSPINFKEAALRIKQSACWTENKKREKENKKAQFSANIFQSSNMMSKFREQQMRLPVLEHIAEDVSAKSKVRMVKIPLGRLKPLNADQVKKRFLMKYKHEPMQSQQ